MNVCHPRFAISIQRAQQPGFFAIPSVETHPTIPNTSLPRVADHLKSQLRLRTKDPLLLRDSRPITPPRRVNPLLWKIESFVRERYVAAAPQASEHPDLAIVHFPQTPVPLSSHPNGLVAFFGNRAFIDNQETVLGLSKSRIHIVGNLIQNGSVAPRRLRNEVLIGLVVDIRHHFGHALHVSLLRLDQAEQVLPGLFVYIARSAGEKAAEPRMKHAQSITSALKDLSVPTTFSRYRRLLAAGAGVVGCLFDGPQDIHARVQYTKGSLLSRTF
jgi:hypothetical protein